MKKFASAALCVLMLAGLAGCIIAPGPGPRHAGYWVPGHYGPYGGWRPGHYQ